MKDVIILTATLLLMLYGFRIMRHIDRFLEAGGISRAESRAASKKVLIMESSEGTQNDSDMIEVLTVLNHYSATYDVVYSPLIPELGEYDYVMALSANDMDNLVLCAESKRLLKNPYTVAKCNDKVYASVFNREDVDAIVFDEESIGEIFRKQVVA